MKKGLLLLLAYPILISGCKAQQVVVPSGANTAEAGTKSTEIVQDTFAKISWDEIRWDFGEIVSGDTVEHSYGFVNSGTVDFQISTVKPTCGCTAVEYTRDAVPPGGRGFVKVRFDSSHKTGRMQKSATVFGNTSPAGRIVTFTVNILPKPSESQQD